MIAATNASPDVKRLRERFAPTLAQLCVSWSQLHFTGLHNQNPTLLLFGADSLRASMLAAATYTHVLNLLRRVGAM